MADNVFVIGDVHGNLDRLEALLKQEGLLVLCDHCDGAGSYSEFCGRNEHEYECTCEVDCGECLGLGIKRARTDVTVVQLGDLGHWGEGNSPTGDLLCYKYVTENRWCDVVLWGNHDRAMVDPGHAFTGYRPDYQTGHYLKMLYNEGRLQMAFEAHGFLLTHAGLAMAFIQQKVDDKLKTDPVAFADWINESDDHWHSTKEWEDQQANGIINAIGARRGGRSAVGGLLWRDIEENLYDGFRQVFGHSADSKKGKVRYCAKSTHTRDVDLAQEWAEKTALSYCIDVGGKRGHGFDSLAGIWLPSEKIVRVDL